LKKVAVGGRKWLVGLDLLRGGAALLVVAHHLYTLADRPPTPVSWFLEASGTVGVVLFYVLSAFLLTRNLLNQKTSAREFYIRRFVRIAPAYYVNFLILFFFMSAPGVIFSLQGLTQTLTNLTFTHYLTPGTSSSLNVNGALWTLSIEFFLYLTLPSIVWVIRKFKAIGWLTIVAIAIAFRYWYSFDENLAEFYFSEGILSANQSLYLLRQPPSTLIVFLVGIALAFAFDTKLISRLTSHNRPILLILGGSLLVLLGMSTILDVYSINSRWTFYVFDVAIAIALAPLLLGFSSLNISFEGKLSQAGKWVGDRSFGLYLWHFPIILVAYGRGAFEFPLNDANLSLRVLVAVTLSFVAASMSYRFIERPALDFAKLRLRPKPN
jgi:peptidoglycan/LPS O-acetylase OafA/YrhL